MRKIHILAAFLTLSGLTLLAFAQGSKSERTAITAGTVEELRWLAGNWAGNDGGVAMEEYWMEPKGGLMLGLHRDVRDRAKTFFEYLRIEGRADGVVYLASPMGKGPTPFKLKESSPNRVVFENPTHDFPQRIIYSLEGDKLRARIEGKDAGTDKSSEWTWKRQK